MTVTVPTISVRCPHRNVQHTAMKETSPLHLDDSEASNADVIKHRRPEEPKLYPFNPQTAFQKLVPPVVADDKDEGRSKPSPLESGFKPLHGHSNEKEALCVPENLVGNSEVLSVGVVTPDDSYYTLYPNRASSRLPTIDTGLGGSGPYLRSQNSFEFQDENDDFYVEGPASHLRYGDSLRRFLSLRSVSSIGSSTLSRSRPSLQSKLSTRSSLSSRWSFRRGRSQRRDKSAEAMVEEGCRSMPSETGPVELEGIQHNLGPFELNSLTEKEQRDLISRLSKPLSGTVPPRRRIIEDLFGRQLCSPQYVGLRRVYMAQIDKKLETALCESVITNPNPAVWLQPFAYLVEHLGMISQQLTPLESVTTFVLSHTNEFATMMHNSSLTIPETSNFDGEKAGMENAMRFIDPKWYQKTVHEWMLFSLEAWTMLDLSRSIDRRDLVASEMFCDSPIEDLIKPHIPANVPVSFPPSGLPPSTITPAELSASMLHDWKGISFQWTKDITEHLKLDAQNLVVTLYANVAFCHLHSIAKENSSLYKAGFIYHHQLLVEVSETYRLLFGSDRRSQTYFAELEAQGSCHGFFDIFKLPNCDCEPRFLYNVASDFPVFGDRLLALKTLLRPTGIRGLWRDKRDSLQWYTFWAVVFLGCFGGVIAFLQLILSAVQTWASLHQGDLELVHGF